MNKFYVTIPKPCHENWEQMTKEDKGRFCGSCQKTVVDFTNMSDRELAAFLKKPAGSLCGRFHPDQLNREISVPKKRIHWVKYFFAISWPAFVLFLKSCGLKERIAGEVATFSSNKPFNSDKYEYTTIGTVMAPGIMHVDTVMPAIADEEKIEEIIIGKLEPDHYVSPEIVPIVGEIAAMDSSTLIKDTMTQEPAYKELDTVVVSASQRIECSRVLMGGVSMISTITATPAMQPLPEAIAPSFSVYPNPVRMGSLLTIKFSTNKEVPESVHVLNASGQLIAVRKVNASGISTTNQLLIPSNLATGIYFVHLVFRSGSIERSSVMITK